MTTTASKHAGTDNFSSKDHSTFYSVRQQKTGGTVAKFHVIQHNPAVQMYCACLIKLPHPTTGGSFAGSLLRSNKYLFVNSKIAASRCQWTCALEANDNPERRGVWRMRVLSQESRHKSMKSDGQRRDGGD